MTDTGGPGENLQAEGETGKVRTDLPTVVPPSAGFLLQLFVIPLIIVAIIVGVWAMFSWLVHLGNDPKDLVRDISAMNDASWQKANILADLLRNPEFDYIKEDAALAQELVHVLREEIQNARMDEQRVRLRLYLCLCLGKFRVPQVVPPLVLAANTEREPVEVSVRRSAVLAFADLAGNPGWKEKLSSNPEVMRAVLEASRARGNNMEDELQRGELRSAAAYALGVIGGPEAEERLLRLLDDAHANTRYNAATGLARTADPRAQSVLVEMLDPDNAEATRTETTDRGRATKRVNVLLAGISAAVRMQDAPRDADLTPLIRALEKLVAADVERKVRILAEEALNGLREGRREG
jgi:HEAT repeat protein